MKQQTLNKDRLVGLLCLSACGILIGLGFLLGKQPDAVPPVVPTLPSRVVHLPNAAERPACAEKKPESILLAAVNPGPRVEAPAPPDQPTSPVPPRSLEPVSKQPAKVPEIKPRLIEPVPAVPRPRIPRHYSHIRIAMLGYGANAKGAFADEMLKHSVDLVIINPVHLKHFKAVAPKTPLVIYTNTTNLYLELLTDWLQFADARGLSREAAFYHAAQAIPFRGDSPSSQPATWFWAVLRDGHVANLTFAAHSKAGRFPLGELGESVYLGYPERFREINADLFSGGQGWGSVLEFVNEVDRAGRPRRWAPLKLLEDGTAGLTRSGRLTFDPPAGWKTATLGGSARLFYVRVRATRDGIPPVAHNLLGRDYVNAGLTHQGTIPAFDYQADANHDGYLDEAEYARRARGKDARFVYESRMLTESYGQMRFPTNPAPAGFRAWAVEYHIRYIQKNPLADGLFMDNCDGRPPLAAGQLVERVTRYPQEYGELLQAIGAAIKPRSILANTNPNPRADPLVQYNPAYMAEFAIRPLAHNWAYFEDLADMVTRRLKLASPPPLSIIDSHPQAFPQRRALNDPRLQLATLAYYYLICDPEWTYLMLYGGCEPSSPWREHWLPAATYDVGQPLGTRSVWQTGPDPSDRTRTYRIYQRPFGKALVLYKPLSHVRGNYKPSSIGKETATTHAVAGTYRLLHADGTLGETTTSVTLRNGEGAILIKAR